MGDVKKLEEAKCLYKDANADQRYVLERLFPELKECEDEWIEDYWKHHKVINHYSYDKGEEIQFDHQGFVRFCKKYCMKHAEWHAEDEQNLNACLGYLPDEFLARWLKDVIHREYDEPVWSEEDEKIFNRICDIIHCAAYENCEVDENGEEQGEYARIINWFKSIKDSVRPQNLTVTDEELSQAKKDAYNDALNKIEYHNGEPTFDDGWSAAILYLKKRNAQPQDTLKQSNEEVEQLIEEASEYLRKYADHHVQGGNSKVYIHSIADGLESLYCPLAQLKSGGSQVMKRWKPSEEQIEALAEIVNGIANICGEECAFDLRTLLGDLKKLMGE